MSIFFLRFTVPSSFFSPQVVFKTPVSILDNPKINQWLSMVEKEMRFNLATLLAQAVEGITQFNSESIQPGQRAA